jgi:endonuclease YncB( thermonuclease family)
VPSLDLTRVPKTYAELLRAVKLTLFEGQRAADLAWVQTFHETGRLIHCHVLLKKDRADHGAQVIRQLSNDTGTAERRLYECRQFYRCFPNLRLIAELGWTRGLLLTQVADESERGTLVAEVLKDGLLTDEVRARVRALNAADKTTPGSTTGDSSPVVKVALLTPKRGTPGLHPIVDRGDGPVIDLGFKLSRDLSPNSKLTTSDIVRLTETGARRIDGATKAELFTYPATVRRVIDGDTLAVALRVAPETSLDMKLRLRGLDCPELSTAAGRAAKLFVDDLIKPGDEVIISTTKPDKYDRYLADVFAVTKRGAEGAEPRAAEEIFLNNSLLEGGYAVRYDGGAKEVE